MAGLYGYICFSCVLFFWLVASFRSDDDLENGRDFSALPDPRTILSDPAGDGSPIIIWLVVESGPWCRSDDDLRLLGCW